jgi:hypothetical protein
MSLTRLVILEDSWYIKSEVFILIHNRALTPRAIIHPRLLSTS